MNNSNDLSWYVLRITYSREMAVKAFLDSVQIENFIPMRYECISKGERRFRRLVPAVHNLLFVRSSREKIDEIRQTQSILLPVRYLMNRETLQPLTVSDVQMRHFMSVAGASREEILYLSPAMALKKGQRVRVTGGAFEGVEGELVSIQGDRRVVVSIEGLMTVATAFIHPSLVEPITD